MSVKLFDLLSQKEGFWTGFVQLVYLLPEQDDLVAEGAVFRVSFSRFALIKVGFQIHHELIQLMKIYVGHDR